MDVTLPRNVPARNPWMPRVTPAAAARQLGDVARTMDFASFAVLSSDDGRFSARLSLRFAPITLP
jgi:hypothetical protein